MGRTARTEGRQTSLQEFFKKHGGRYKRIRKSCKNRPHPLVYEGKKAILRQLELLCQSNLIDLFYADESHFSSEGYVPYAWQFKDENVCVLSEKGYKLNVFALISRDNRCIWSISPQSIKADFVIEQLDKLSFSIQKETVIVLDNARLHKGRKMKERMAIWQERGLFIFFLPTYSPELNIAETLWRVMKTKWIRPQDYMSKDELAYAINRCLANVGKELRNKF